MPPWVVGVGGSLNAFYWYQIFALDSVVVEVQKLFSSHGSLLTIAMYHTHIKLTHYDETKKRAQDSQVVKAKENNKLSHGGSSYRYASGTNSRIKALLQSCHRV